MLVHERIAKRPHLRPRNGVFHPYFHITLASG
jgi:hypothetical protein